MSKSFGKHVRDAREALGWSQEELGTRVSVSGAQVSRIESGKRAGGLGTLVAIAGVLNISLDLLKEGPGDDVAPGNVAAGDTDAKPGLEDAPTVPA